MPLRIYWFEAKQLDRVTNFSSRTEMIRHILDMGGEIHYYSSMFRTPKTYGFPGNIHYLGRSTNRYLRYVEFNTLVVLKAAWLALRSPQAVFMVNQDLTRHLAPARLISRLFRKKHRFVVDIRTLPTSVDNFDRDMKRFHRRFAYAAKHFDGFSFITPFMKRIVLEKYPRLTAPRTVCWSSGVDLDTFCCGKCDYADPAPDCFRIFYHGAICRDRGNLTLVQACERLVRAGRKLHLRQIGQQLDTAVADYIGQHDLADWCELLPARPISEMPQLIAACDLPVFPFPYFMAWRVSSPIKLMEYLAMGKPVLAPAMECFTDILPEESGLVTYYDPRREDAVEALAEAIAAIMDRRGGDAAKFPCDPRCTEFVRENFLWRRQAEKLYEFCAGLLNAETA